MSSYIQLAPFYEELFPIQGGLLSYLKEQLDESAQILDLGCGTGLLVEKLSESFSHAKGIDPDPDMIQAGLSKNPKRQISCQYLSNLTSTEPFEAILCVGNVLSYFPPEAVQTLSTDLSSRLKSGGYWILQTVNWNAKDNSGLWKFLPKEVNNYRLEREYELDANTALFNLRLTHKGILLAEQKHELYKHQREFLIRTFSSTFDLIHEWSDWQQKPWKPEGSDATIQIWRKK